MKAKEEIKNYQNRSNFIVMGLLYLLLKNKNSKMIKSNLNNQRKQNLLQRLPKVTPNKLNNHKSSKYKSRNDYK
jgi:hypothetical protein